MLESISRPLPVQLFDFADRALRMVGVRRQRFDPAALEAAASRAAGLSDFGPPDYAEGLAVFCRSLEEDARLDILGRAIMESAVKRILENRLLWVDCKKRRPEIFAAPLTPPIIVVGLPRTGTTALHRLLAHDPRNHAPPTWQVWRPLPRPHGPDRRREVAVRAIDGLRRLVPALDSKHHLDADAAEECWHLRDPSFLGPGPYHLAACWGFYEWLARQDVGPSYGMYRDYLQILQADVPDQRLIMKAPSHAPQVADLEAAVPEAKLVQTHRDPVELAGSMASLAHTMTAITSPRFSPQEIGQIALRMLRDFVRGNLEQRDRLTGHVVDVRYVDFVADPLGTAQRIYEEHGIPWTDEIAAAMRGGVKERPQNRHGRHDYGLADVGIREAEVREIFADYSARFL